MKIELFLGISFMPVAPGYKLFALKIRARQELQRYIKACNDALLEHRMQQAGITRCPLYDRKGDTGSNTR